MALVDQFRAITGGLPDDWEVARLRLTMEDESDSARAVAVLGPTNPGRRGRVIHFQCARRGGGLGADRVVALLRRLDQERLHGTVELADVRDADTTVANPRLTLAAAWDAEVAALPPDWSHLYGEVTLTSSDHTEPAALRLSPLNPTRHGTRPVLRFRVARTAGYGGSPEMAHRSFERLDEAGIRGSVRIVHAVSDVFPARTQGPVWYSGGKVV